MRNTTEKPSQHTLTRLKEAKLTQAQLKERMTYNPATGEFHSLTQPDRWRALGTITPEGYRILNISGVRFLAHRVAFLYMEGAFPPEFVDHINGVRDDNRWENLRHATYNQNAHNSRLRTDNTSGYRGVSWSNHHQQWYAQIMFEKKLYNLGYYDTPEEAYKVVTKAREELHGDYAATRDSELSIEERIAIRESRAPRLQKWKQTNRTKETKPRRRIKLAGLDNLTPSEINKGGRIRLMARANYYTPEYNAELSNMLTRDMMKHPIWNLVNTVGNYIEKEKL